MSDFVTNISEKGNICRLGTVYLAGLAVAAVLIRLISWHSVYPEGKYLFFWQNDAYYHLHRAAIMAAHFPFYPTLDYFLAFPYGAEAPWPPLYGYLLVAFSLPLRIFFTAGDSLKLAVALLPVLFAGLLVPAVFLLVRACFSRTAAYLAAFFTAFSLLYIPDEPYYSMFGAGDQNMAEAFFAVLFFYFYTRNLLLCLKRERSPFMMTLMPGIALGLCLLLWQGSVIFAAAVSAYAMGMVMRERGAGIVSFHLLVMFFAALLTALVRAWIPSTTEQTLFSFGFFSWFQPFFCILCMIPVLFMHAVMHYFRTRNRRWLFGWLVGIFLLSCLVILFSNLLPHLLSGLGYVFRQDPWLSKIEEFQAPFSISDFLVAPGARSFREWIHLFCYALPLFLLAMLIMRFRKRRPGELWMLLMILFIAPLAFQQVRWVIIYSVLISISLGILLSSLFRRFSPGIAVLLGILILAIPLPFLYAKSDLSGILEKPIDGDLFSALTWLRKNTPPPGDPVEQTDTPDYGILAHWNVGHWLISIARRPSIASPFGSQLRGRGLEDSLEFCMTPEESHAAAICEERKIRYVLMEDFLYSLCELSAIVDPGFVEQYFTRRQYQGIPYYMPGQAFFRLVYPRMYLYDGSGRGNIAPLKRFRLVWESRHPLKRPYYPAPVNAVKIFEFVRGANIQGKAPAGSRIHLRINLTTNRGRRFVYQATAVAGSPGVYSLVVPYSTEGKRYAVRSAKPFAWLTCNSTDIEIQIKEADVRRGRTVICNFE